MKTILKTIFFCMTLNSMAQDNDEKEYEPITINPMIISTDLFAPWSVSVEKIFKENYAVKFRYHESVLIKDFYGDGFLKSNISSIKSFMVEYKYYPKAVYNKKINPYIGVYGKLRSLIRYNLGSESVMNTIGGINAGLFGIYKHVSMEVNLGGGLSFYHFKDKEVLPIDIRANISLGIPLY
jgi:hypothetical protein